MKIPRFPFVGAVLIILEVPRIILMVLAKFLNVILGKMLLLFFMMEQFMDVLILKEQKDLSKEILRLIISLMFGKMVLKFIEMNLH